MPTPVFLSSPGDDNKLTLTGSGTDPGTGTVLSGNDPDSPDIHFSGGTGSSINNLTVSIPDDAGPQDKIGLALDDGATGSGLNVTFEQHLVNGDPSLAVRTTGVRLVDGATLKDSTVRLYSSNFNRAVTVYGGGNVVGSHLNAYFNVLQGDATGPVEIRRSTLEAIYSGAQTEGGTMNIRDSLILNPDGGIGIVADNFDAPGNVLIDGSTILGAPGSIGAQVQALGESGGDNGVTDFRLNNSIIYGQNQAIAYQEQFDAGTLTINVDSSAYNSSRLVEQEGEGTPTLTIKEPVELNGVDPMFTDPGNGDYSLKAGSPLIDAGQTTLPAAGSLDYPGNPRACDGNDDGTIQRDIGAFEFRSDPNDDCTYPAATVGDPQGTATSTSRTFTLTSSKPNSTYLCSLDGAAFTACQTLYTASGLSVGNHNLKVKARDIYGNVQASPTEKTFKVEALTPADTTAPKVIGVKAPKKTKAAWVKVSFKSNENSSAFKCRLNKGKWKSCKSPWKTPRLKQGKNTISIQAIDRAGNKSKVAKRVIKKLRKRN